MCMHGVISFVSENYSEHEEFIGNDAIKLEHSWKHEQQKFNFVEML